MLFEASQSKQDGDTQKMKHSRTEDDSINYLPVSELQRPTTFPEVSQSTKTPSCSPKSCPLFHTENFLKPFSIMTSLKCNLNKPNS